MKIDSAYASYGVIVGAPDKAEPPHVEAPRLNYAAVLKKFRWSDAQFELAKRFGFPSSMVRASVAREGNEAGGARWDRVWPEDLLDAWARNLMSEIETLQLARIVR